MEKLAYIKKLPNGKYRVYSEKGKNMGTFSTEEEAKKRLQDIHFFKSRKANGEIVGPKFAEPIAELISVHGLFPSQNELTEFLEIKGMEDFEELFKWALKELIRESAGEPIQNSQPLSKSDISDLSEPPQDLVSIANFDMLALENVKPGDLFKFLKTKDSYIEITEVTDNTVVGILKGESIPEGHRVVYPKSEFLLWWMSGLFVRMVTFSEGSEAQEKA
jgi:hypothetical protein